MSATDDGARLIAGRYLLISEVGRGAMGVVWLARDERLGRTVAVKELRAGVGLSSTQVEQSYLRARREARIAASLNHPHAVAVYDVVEQEERPYLVMEYVPSRSLAEVLRERASLEPAEVAEIGAQLASALVAAHEAGIVHRDIKPGNILLADSGGAKLTDFGISRAIGDVTVTGTGEMLGTPAYFAPEVAQGRSASAASDVFSLGATLYAAVEGEPPFGTGPSAIALLLRIANGEIRPPERIGPLTDTLMWMLGNNPEGRPSMETSRRELSAIAVSSFPDAGTEQIPETSAAPVPEAADAVPEPADSAAGSASAAESGDRAAAAVAAASAAVSERPPSVPKAKSSNTGTNSRRFLLPWWAWLGVAAIATAGVIAGLVASGGPSASNLAPPPAASSTKTASATTTKSSGGVGKATTSATPRASASATATASATASQTASATPSASTTASPSGDVSTQLTSMLSHYYTLVPGDLDEAWGYMTPDYQTNHAGGPTGYRDFWDEIRSVSASDITAQLPSTVTATIVYDYKNGQTVVEPTSYGLVLSDGIWKIASSAVISSTTTG
jgi:eukaryotic-like serine/threonine-protein kinase